MAVGIVIHISVGQEKRTEFFSTEHIRFGSDEASDLQIHTTKVAFEGVWFELDWGENEYRITDFNKDLNLTLNGEPLRRYVAIGDGDIIAFPNAEISIAFFSLTSKSSLITTNREQPHIAQFIEEAAIGAAATPKRDDAKAFLREFVRELSREITWTTKLIVLGIVVGTLSGIFYLGFAISKELQKSRLQSEQQAQIINSLQEKIVETNDQISDLDKSNKDIIKSVSLAPNLRVEYGNGVCLIVGVYDLVDRRNGKTLRYPDPQSFQQDLYEQPSVPVQEDLVEPQMQMGLTTEGNGTPLEYDFIGTGFHVGDGFIVTNRHVVQPWKEDELVQQMIRDSKGRARVKKLVIYFPNIAQPFPLKIRQLGAREDVAVAQIDAANMPEGIPVLPLDTEDDAVAIGKTVVSMGYPNGPDRLLAMIDDEEAKNINSKFGGSRQALINFLAQSKKIVPLTTQGSITDLDSRRVVHDAKTAEGGSGAPLFGQTGKVIGVNFGVFTSSDAVNMAVPIRFAIEILKKAGWLSSEEKKAAGDQNQTANVDSNVNKK